MRSEGSLPPVIFGRYRRNVVSFNETIFYYIFVVAVTTVVIAFNITFHYLYISVCIIVFKFFAITLIIAVKAFKDPFLFHPKSRITPQNEASVFYVNRPEIIPRRDYFHPAAPVTVANHNQNIIFVHPANNED